MIRAWFVAFAFTQLVEVPIWSVGLRCSPLVAFGASMMTHPIVCFVICGPYWDASYPTKVILAELFAWSVEACYFAFLFNVQKRKACLWSLIANGASFGFGMLSRALIGAP